MAEDTEKKFHSIMDKLFHSPKSNLPSSPSIGQKMRGQKRSYSAMQPHYKGDKGEGALNAAQAPPCRPWDRGDLMRRVATFKSMRWFAKPKAMDAMNCARRGWVNVDMDIIACEVCGARLQFSTPSTWSQQQVEKAALVFSLKLDSGHKLLCPWLDNACDEKLAFFPPLPAPVLVDHYKERSASLLQLSALPSISASVIKSMKSPQLEFFLKQSIVVECGAGPDNSSWTEYFGNDIEAVSGDLYYQAHRLLSLCGWEPRLLPYMVDCGDQSNEPANNTDFSGLSNVAAGEKNNKLSVYVSGSGENGKENEGSVAPIVHYDPSSTVLECKLCGASIGLWAFSTVRRPLELIRVVGYAETDDGRNHGSKHATIENHGINEKSGSSTVNKEARLTRETVFNFSIAGGPPPTKQNFRATISFPVIGRNVRARFSHESLEFRNTGEKGHAFSNPIVEGSVDNMQSVETGSSGANNTPAVQDLENLNQADGDPGSSIVGVSGTVSQGHSGILHGSDVQLDSSSISVDDSSDLQQMPPDETALRKDSSRSPSAGQKDNGVGDAAKVVSQKDVSSTSMETDLRRNLSDGKMEFHPIRQHRHFCPWVASTGTTAPGWQQTLSALQKEKVFSLPESDDCPSSPSLIKIDDPITSIRKLFESPPTKRTKPAST